MRQQEICFKLASRLLYALELRPCWKSFKSPFFKREKMYVFKWCCCSVRRNQCLEQNRWFFAQNFKIRSLLLDVRPHMKDQDVSFSVIFACTCPMKESHVAIQTKTQTEGRCGNGITTNSRRHADPCFTQVGPASDAFSREIAVLCSVDASWSCYCWELLLKMVCSCFSHFDTTRQILVCCRKEMTYVTQLTYRPMPRIEAHHKVSAIMWNIVGMLLFASFLGTCQGCRHTPTLISEL